jgi:hypothetical protein
VPELDCWIEKRALNASPSNDVNNLGGGPASLVATAVCMKPEKEKSYKLAALAGLVAGRIKPTHAMTIISGRCILYIAHSPRGLKSIRSWRRARQRNFCGSSTAAEDYLRTVLSGCQSEVPKIICIDSAGPSKNLYLGFAAMKASFAIERLHP